MIRRHSLIPVLSLERVQRLHTRLFEVACIPRDNDQFMNQRGGRNQTIFDGQRLTGSSKVSDKLSPAKTCVGFERKAEDSGYAFIEPPFQSLAAFSGGQNIDPEPDLA